MTEPFTLRETERSRIFISYSMADRHRVEALASFIKVLGHDVFTGDPLFLPGRHWQEDLEEALRAADMLLVFWTRHAAESDWVLWEYEFFDTWFPDRPLVPVRGDTTALPPRLQVRQYIDFRSENIHPENPHDNLEFYDSCFISYSSKDQEFAKRLRTDLFNQGVRCYYAAEDIQGGRKIHEQIDQAIRSHKRLLLVLSAHSMQSEWVKTEIAKARQREVREQRQMLFPIRLVPFEALRDWECFDADTGKDSAREIREYYIPDFSNWKNSDDYQKAFQQLLRDLKPGI
jgi:hypothetical protein